MSTVFEDPVAAAAAQLTYGDKPIVTMNSTAEIVITTLLGLGTIAVLVYAYRLCRSSKSTWPVWIVLGTLPCITFEYWGQALTHYLYPQVGGLSVPLYIFGQNINLYTVLIYPVYISTVTLILFNRFDSGKLTVKLYWKIFIGFMVFAACFEPPAIAFKLWYYWGAGQPFESLGLPYYWIFTNAAMVLILAPTLRYIWNNLLNRRHTWALFFAMPFVLQGCMWALLLPEIFALNTVAVGVGAAFWPNVAAAFCSLLSIGLVKIGSLFVERQNAQSKQDVKVEEMAAVAVGRADA